MACILMKGWNAVQSGCILCIFCDDIGVHFVGNNVFWIVHISFIVNVIHDAFDVLDPCFYLDIFASQNRPWRALICRLHI